MLIQYKLQLTQHSVTCVHVSCMEIGVHRRVHSSRVTQACKFFAQARKHLENTICSY